MKRRIQYILLLAVLAVTMPPFPVHAEDIELDALSIAALNIDGEKIPSALLARATVENINLALHSACKEANIEYHDINIQLDKYTRFFNVVDIAIETLQTGVIAVNTYNNVTETVKKYKNLLTNFHNQCLKNGNVMTTDAQIIAAAGSAIEDIMKEINAIYKDLSFTATSLFGGCTAEEYAWLTNHTQSCLERINRIVSQAYIQTWKYIQMRTGYWKKEVYMSRSKEDVLKGALGRWQQSIEEARNKNKKQAL